MAGVLNGLASYVTKMLADMARDEVALLIGVTGKIDDLSVKLGDLKNFLADADRRMITDESVQGWVEELKRAMYLATDILDLCQLKAMEKGPSKDMGCLNPLLFCMRNPLHAHDIGSRIKTLNQKLDDICNRGGCFNFIKLEAYQDRSMSRPLANDRKTDSLMEREGTIGEKIEEDKKALLEVLTREGPSEKTDRLMVVAIVGVGGIGKTTLGKKVFNDEVIEGKFSKKIWLSITQQFSDVELLSTAITDAGGDLPKGSGAQQRALLVHALRDVIKDKKFFLVLDDIWGVDAWDKVLMTPFSYGGTGSRVLITTRHDTVGRSLKAVHYHHVEKLAPQDAWSLLKKQVVTSEGNEPDVDKLTDIGLQIIAKCDGLPLAIKVMGGLLCKKEKTRSDWEDVLKNDIWSVSRMQEDLNHAIYLSYEDLPPSLKQCFLQFSLKPKKTVIHMNKLVGMWISEGLVHGDSYSLEEEGINNYKELILRNLIETDTRYPGQYFCNMHDVIRSFAEFVARDEALVAHGGDTTKLKLRSHNFLRLSIETTSGESSGFEWTYLTKQKSLRTLLLTGSFRIQPSDSLITFSSLRTLSIECAKFATLLESVCHLKHLRYLSLRSCSDISSLPENIHKLKFLQHICLIDCEGLEKLPDSIVKLQELRYVDISNTHVNNVPRGFGALQNLRSLYGFPAYVDGDWCSLEELGSLAQLKGLGLVGLENVSDNSSVAKASLGSKAHLTRLDLSCGSKVGDDMLPKGGFSKEGERRIEMMYDMLCPPPSLEYINIEGYFGRHLPRWMMRTSIVPLENLRILYMCYMTFCTQLPDGLSQLPCLEYLMVFRAPTIKHVGPEFVQPYNHRHHPSSKPMLAFPKLQELVLHHMVEWEEWEWEKEVHAMPALEELRICKCKLRCIPPGLAFHARFLKKLTMWNVKGLQSIENFASVVELSLFDIPYLTRISNFPNLLKLEIKFCPKLELLQEINALRRLVLTLFYSEEQLPPFLQTVKPRHLLLDCHVGLLASMAAGKSGPEWNKFSHIQKVEAYSNFEGIEKRWHVFYTSEPYNMKTNIDLQSLKMYCDGYEDRSEEEWMCHDPAIKRTEEELAWIQNHASISRR